MEKPVCTLSVYTKPNFCSSATKLLKLVYTPLNVFVDKCIAKYINSLYNISLQYIILIPVYNIFRVGFLLTRRMIELVEQNE